MCVRVRRELSGRVERERESCAASSARAMGMGVGWGLGSFSRRAVPRVVARAALASAAALSRTLRSREAVVRMPSSPKPMIRRLACKQRHFRCFLLILDFSTQPQPQPPQPVVVGPYMSIFELFYYLITSYHCLATAYCSLPPPPYAACVMPLRAHPLAAVCAAAPGGWAPGQGARGKAN